MGWWGKRENKEERGKDECGRGGENWGGVSGEVGMRVEGGAEGEIGKKVVGCGV